MAPLAARVHAVVLGAAGYGGGELLRLLGAHPAVVALTAASRSHAEQPYHQAHPQLRGVVEGGFVAEPDWRALAAANPLVVFAALPHGELAARYPALEREWQAHGIAERVTLIDLSGDHRLGDAAAYARHYGAPHPHPENLGRFVYGLPEWQRERIAAPAAGGKRIANPGCFATGLQLALLPLLDEALDWVAASGTTGSSGSGALPSATTHHPTRADDYRAYKPLAHQHLGEVEQLLAARGNRAQLSFVPHSAPLVRGVSCTLHARLPDQGKGARAAVAAEMVKAYYAAEPFVRVVEGPPRLAVVAGSNFCDLGVAAAGELLVVMTALDNLVKGMAGQAVQNMNLALGLPERAGLMQAPLYP